MKVDALDSSLYLHKIADGEVSPVPAPFHPHVQYPEYRGETGAARNSLYDAVREMFRSLGYDKENFGTPQWNPLGEFIGQGDSVLIKPNMVLHRSYRDSEDYHSVVTHPALVRSVVDYVAIALKGKGKIVIGDAPINSADFGLIRDNMGLSHLEAFYRGSGIDLSVLDFRLFTMEKDQAGIVRNQARVVTADEHIVVRFGKESALAEYGENYKNFRVTEYDGDEMPVRHNVDAHEYCIHRSVCDADVIISLPKIKTHHKAGYTCAMKNYVGINGSKDWLPHHRKFSVKEGGDEYLHPSLRKRAISRSWDIRWKLKSVSLQRALRLFERSVRWTRKLVPFPDDFFEGSWWGNTTISRTVNDLNRAVIYCDKRGFLQDTPQRKILYLVDGIVCGEGDGPMAASSKRCNMLIWGQNAFAVDMLVITLMGFDYRLIDTVNVTRTVARYPVFKKEPEEIFVRTNLAEGALRLSNVRSFLAYRFRPPQGWIGHIEIRGEE